MGHADTAAAVAAVRVVRPLLADLVAGYDRAVQEARAYVVSHDLVTLADGEELQRDGDPCAACAACSPSPPTTRRAPSPRGSSASTT